MITQLITPDPNISCQPGWCLDYVRRTFKVIPVATGSASESWFSSPSQHADWNFPVGGWVPVYFGIDSVPEGHIVLLAPDGSVYSTSDNATVPHHHPSIADLMAYYAEYGLPLKYRGWSEHVEGVHVIDVSATGGASIGPDSITTTPQEDTLAAADVQQIIDHIDQRIDNLTAAGVAGDHLAGPLYQMAQNVSSINESLQPGQAGVRNAGAVYAALAAAGSAVDPAKLAASIVAALPTDLANQVVAAMGTALQGKA